MSCRAVPSRVVPCLAVSCRALSCRVVGIGEGGRPNLNECRCTDSASARKHATACGRSHHQPLLLAPLPTFQCLHRAGNDDWSSSLFLSPTSECVLYIFMICLLHKLRTCSYVARCSTRAHTPMASFFMVAFSPTPTKTSSRGCFVGGSSCFEECPPPQHQVLDQKPGPKAVARPITITITINNNTDNIIIALSLALSLSILL